MKSQIVALAIVLAGLPALAWGQASCGCNSRGPVRPVSYGAWADYQPAGSRDGCGCSSCTSCAPTCCNPCCGQQLLCIIPNTVRKIGCVLDRLIPCGPRCCSSCGSPSCTSGCPSCTSPAMDPFIDDQPMPPMPKPTQETRRQPTVRAPRDYAAAPAPSNKVASTRPATKSILTRNTQPVEEVSRANHTDSPAKKPQPVVRRTSAVEPITSTSTMASARRATTAIPHNPLR